MDSLADSELARALRDKKDLKVVLKYYPILYNKLFNRYNRIYEY